MIKTSNRNINDFKDESDGGIVSELNFNVIFEGFKRGAISFLTFIYDKDGKLLLQFSPISDISLKSHKFALSDSITKIIYIVSTDSLPNTFSFVSRQFNINITFKKDEKVRVFKLPYFVIKNHSYNLVKESKELVNRSALPAELRVIFEEMYLAGPFTIQKSNFF
ncbi:MAG: hypothetical protein ACP5T9_05885 [Thermoplasmata archaeon]